MKKILIILLTLAMLTLTLSSCNGTAEEQLPQETIPEGAVPVLSNYKSLSYLTPGSYDESKFEDGTWARYGYTTYVAYVSGSLAVMPTHSHGSSTDPYVSRSEILSYENVFGCTSGVYLDGERIIDEECVALLHSDIDQRLLAFTTTKDSSCIYEFTRDSSDEGFVLSENRITFNSKMHLVYFEWRTRTYSAPSKVYVITANDVVILDTKEYLNTRDGDLSCVGTTTLTPPDWWEFVRPTNATQTDDGTLFIGEREGVIGIAADGSFTYYPIDYLAVNRDTSKK